MNPEYIASKVKIIRDEIMSHVPVENHEVVEAGLALAELLVVAISANSHNLHLVANGITAQTKILCHAYNLSADEQEKLGIPANDDQAQG